MTPAGPAILVVDDVPENRDLLLRRLQRLGFSRIDQAENGREALAAIETKPYDLVLLDIMMPELDGFGVLEALKGDGRIVDLPVIVISALNEIDPIVRCIELGADDFMFKPFNPTLLKARVLATLEKKSLRDRTREELRRKRIELNEARTLQLSLVPPPFSGEVAGCAISIDVLLEPAKEVGGDLVDHFQIGDGLVVLGLGDVSDKGAGSALMMARTHALLRGLAARPDAADIFRSPEIALGLVNAALAQGNEGCMFVTFVLAAFAPATGRFAYVRAGHIPPYLRRASGDLDRLDRLGGPPLGLSDTVRYQPGEVTLAPGDRVLILTDGFTEAQNGDELLFGDRRIADFAGSISAAEQNPLQRLYRDVRAFEEERPASDDMAAVLLTLHEPAR
jgi:sigma-B regulation protein RsbU (phosphoserine phosphatase)